MMPIFSENNPHWAALRAEQQKRHGTAIAYVKRQVGAGTEYANEVARVVLSKSGAYYQLNELPEEFVGAVGGDVTHRLIGESEAQETMAQLAVLVRGVDGGGVSARELSLYVLYPGGSLQSKRAMFVFDHRPGVSDPFAHGVLLPRFVPRVFKLRLDLDPGQQPPGFPPSGIVLLLTPTHTDGGQCLLVTIPRSADVRDLGAQAPLPKNARLN